MYSTPSAAVSGVQPFLFTTSSRGALVDEELDHRNGAAAIHRAVQRRLAFLVDRVHVAAACLEDQLDRGERFLVRARVLARRPDADARRRHQRGGAVVRREACVGAAFEQHAHQRHIGRFRCQQERRRAEAVQHVAIAVARLLLLSGVDVGALRHQLANERPGCRHHRSPPGRAG